MSAPEQRAGPQDKQQEEKKLESRARDHLANERTFLAWLRTGVALIALGFVVARFGLLLRELGAQGTTPSGNFLGAHVSAIFGTAIVLLAAALLGLSYARYRGNTHALDSGNYRSHPALTTATTAIVILIAVALAAYLLFTP